MFASVELHVVPVGVEVSVSAYVAECERILREEGFEPELHAHGTNFTGEWDDIMAAVRRCHEAMHDMGAPRIAATLKIDTRSDRVQTLDEKVESVRRASHQGVRLS